jgi:hypothetical protein
MIAIWTEIEPLLAKLDRSVEELRRTRSEEIDSVVAKLQQIIDNIRDETGKSRVVH